MSEIPLIFASGSPRRREMLENLNVDFRVHITDTDETRHAGELPRDFVSRLAQDKARKASVDLQHSNVAILAADTIVVQGNTVFGKPDDFAHAQQIWRSLSGAKHQVMTAVCLMLHAKLAMQLSVTDVQFEEITEAQMQAYWDSGEPQDKAGAYAIQGLASAWVSSLNGSYSNVVGLPLREVNELLRTINKHWL